MRPTLLLLPTIESADPVISHRGLFLLSFIVSSNRSSSTVWYVIKDTSMKRRRMFSSRVRFTRRCSGDVVDTAAQNMTLKSFTYSGS